MPIGSGRALPAWIGLVPKQRSTGGKERLGAIFKGGDTHLRWLLVARSLAAIRYAQRHRTKPPWLVKLLERRTAKIAALALANKIARIVWVMMTRGGVYREPMAAGRLTDPRSQARTEVGKVNHEIMQDRSNRGPDKPSDSRAQLGACF